MQACASYLANIISVQLMKVANDTVLIIVRGKRTLEYGGHDLKPSFNVFKYLQYYALSEFPLCLPYPPILVSNIDQVYA